MSDKVLTDKQKAFLDALANEAKGDLRMAMDIAGYSRNTSPKEVLVNLTDEIISISKQLLAANSIKAAVKLSDILDKPGTIGADRVISAAKEVLDRAGVIKKEQADNSSKIDAIVILPSKDAIIKALQGE